MPLFRVAFLFYHVLWDLVVNMKKWQGFTNFRRVGNWFFGKVGEFPALLFINTHTESQK
jgi:hypothetical protein